MAEKVAWNRAQRNFGGDGNFLYLDHGKGGINVSDRIKTSTLNGYFIVYKLPQ